MTTQIELIGKYGLSVRGHLGQHLLIDPNYQRKIVDLIHQAPDELIVEIGPGLGALTKPLLERGAEVWAIEKDGRFVEVLEKEFGASGKLHVIHADVLDTDLSKVPPRAARPVKLAGNLPYYITAPIFFHILESRRHFSRAVVTIQKEVADRFTAAPGTREYGRLTLAMRYAADVRQAFDIPPSCFTPRPEVGSTTLVMDFHGDKQRLPKEKEKLLFEVIRIAFSQRRKTLLHILSHEKSVGLERAALEKILAGAGLKEKVRGEELLLKDFMALAEALRAAGGLRKLRQAAGDAV